MRGQGGSTRGGRSRGRGGRSRGSQPPAENEPEVELGASTEENVEPELEQNEEVNAVIDVPLVQDNLGRVMVIPDDFAGRFHSPRGRVSRTLFRIFKKRWYPEGHRWAGLSNDQIDFYYDEFTKQFWWDPSTSDTKARGIFERHAAARYKDVIYQMKHKKRCMSIGDDVWKAWKASWAKPEAKALSKTYSANRKSAPAGQDGPVTHTGGSRSAYEHKHVIAKETGWVPSIPQLHVHMHTRKDDRTQFIDKKSKDIHDRFQAELQRHQQEVEGGGEGSSSSQPIDEDELFLSLDEFRDNRYFRIGSASGSYQATTQRSRRRRSCVSSQGVSVDERIGSEVVAEMQAKLEAQEAELAEMREFKACSQLQAEEMARNQARLEGSIARMIATLPAEYRPPTEDGGDKEGETN